MELIIRKKSDFLKLPKDIDFINEITYNGENYSVSWLKSGTIWICTNSEYNPNNKKIWDYPIDATLQEFKEYVLNLD